MYGSVVNGDRWIAQRLAHLRGLLDGDVSDEERKAIEAEIATLSQERGISLGGLRQPRLLRRWRHGSGESKPSSDEG